MQALGIWIRNKTDRVPKSIWRFVRGLLVGCALICGLLALGLGWFLTRTSGEIAISKRFMRRDARTVYEAAKAGDYSVVERAGIGRPDALIRDLRKFDKERGRVLSYEVRSVSYPAHAATKCFVSVRVKREKGEFDESLFGILSGFDYAE